MSGGEADVEMHQEGGFEGDELLTAIERLGYVALLQTWHGIDF